ncbi:MAG: hypothetical protein PHP57_12835 [Sideroxydans sp.]|nr:hypothetical protein [Sideroxydans sp.]
MLDATREELTPLALTSLMLLIYTVAINFWLTRRSGNNTFKLQRNFYLGVALIGLGLNWTLIYLNSFVASWFTEEMLGIANAAIQSSLFLLLAPAIYITRALLGSFGGLLKRLTRNFTISAPKNDTLIYLLTPIALIGLLGGVAWPNMLFALFWIAPLLLIVTLQLLWHESTIFAGIHTGDWSRIVTAALAGILVANLTAIAYTIAGGTLIIQLPNLALAQLGYALYGLLILQLGDVVAEFWRGKTQPSKKKPFPIPVVVK